MIDSLKINIKSKIQRLLFIPPFIPIINQSQVNQMQRPEYYEIIPSKNHTPPSFKQKRASLIPCSLHRNFIVPRWMPNRATVWQGQFRSVWNALLPNPEALSSSLHGCSCATNGFVMVHCIRTCTLPPLSQHFVRSVSSSSLFLLWRFVLFLFPFLSFSLSRDPLVSIVLYHEVIILTAFVALLRLANLKIAYIFFRFSVGLRFVIFLLFVNFISRVIRFWKWKWSAWMVIGKWRLERICNS